MANVYVLEQKHKSGGVRCFTDEAELQMRKTDLEMYTPLYPTFTKIKNWRFTEAYIFFLVSIQNKDSGYSLEPLWRGSSHVYQNQYFEQKC